MALGSRQTSTRQGRSFAISTTIGAPGKLFVILKYAADPFPETSTQDRCGAHRPDVCVLGSAVLLLESTCSIMPQPLTAIFSLGWAEAKKRVGMSNTPTKAFSVYIERVSPGRGR